MKQHLSIKTVIILAFVSFSGVLILGYSILSARFFSLGVEHVILDNMKVIVENYHRTVPADKRKSFDYMGSFRITTDWQYMPKGVKISFPDPVPPATELYIAKKKDRPNHKGPDYYVQAVPKDETIYYISQWAGFSTPLGTLGWNSNENIRFLIVLSCCIGIIIAFILWLIIRQISQPMAALNVWAGTLDGARLKDDIPDFYYQELNKLALLIQTKIAAEHEGLERDKEFLHYASHELRTPITIITHNVELLSKVIALDTERARGMRQKIVGRLDRASSNMNALIETLLWMGRQATDDLPAEEIRLDRLLKELVKTLAPLLKGKQVKVQLNIAPAMLVTAEAPLRIVLSNLIRNAFHHTPTGSVTVTQQAGLVTITNETTETLHNASHGFGFGLTLTAKLVEKMGWTYQNLEEPAGRKVTVWFEPSPS